jgi:hypothetical protein
MEALPYRALVRRAPSIPTGRAVRVHLVAGWVTCALPRWAVPDPGAFYGLNPSPADVRACRSCVSSPRVKSSHVLTYPYARGMSPGVARHFMGSLGAPRPTTDMPDPFPLGLGKAGAANPSSLGSGEEDAPDPLPLGSDEAAVSSSSASCWAVDAPSPGGPFCGHLTAQLAQAEYSEGANPRSASLRSVLWGMHDTCPRQ